MEFQLQSVYLIYTWPIVYATLNLASSKEHIYYIPLIYCYNLKLELRLHLGKGLS